jgi:hypothetical protein
LHFRLVQVWFMDFADKPNARTLFLGQTVAIM